MSFLSLVNARESTRRYSDEPVPRDVIDRCVEAARLAPSACNSQPWTFVVIDDEATRSRVQARAFSGVYAITSKFAKTAPCIIAVITEKMNYSAKLGSTLRGVQYSLIDIGMAAEHFALQAEEEGYGTCFIGWFNDGIVKEALGLPKKTSIDLLITLGKPLDGAKRKKVRKSLDDIRVYASEHL